MALLLSILIGVTIGAGFGYYFLKDFDSIILNGLAGLIGSIIALVIYVVFVTDFSSSLLFSWTGSLCCTIGALVVVLAFNGLHKISPKHINKQEHAEDADLEKD